MKELRERWSRLWRSLGKADDTRLLDDLLAAYSEPHRHYHTTQHLAECFEQLDVLGPLAKHAEEVALALWFHDAFYDPSAPDNEEKSAQWASAEMLDHGLSRDAADNIAGLIRLTRHDAVARSTDEQVMIDIDLSILGSASERFAEYEAQVRNEFASVPLDVYCRKRRALLATFLARPRLYHTQLAYERYESAARKNLADSIERLSSVT